MRYLSHLFHQEVLEGRIHPDSRVVLKKEWEQIRDRCGYRVVALNGCFDPPEVHHFHLIRQAGECGSVVMMINSDESIERLKRRPPRRSFEERSLTLLAVRHVVAVIGFHEDTPTEAYRHLLPDLVVRGHAKEVTEVVNNFEGCPVLVVPTLIYEDGTPLSSTLFKKGRQQPHG